MVEFIYVVSWNCGRFRLKATIDDEAMRAPTLFKWRAEGPTHIPLPQAVLTNRQLAEFVANLESVGMRLSSV